MKLEHNRILNNDFFKSLLFAGALCVATGCSADAKGQKPPVLGSSANPTLTMNNGKTIPQVGFGVWTLSNDEARRYVKIAVDKGYRLFDTAQYYNNEAATYQGIVDSGINREDVFIITKVMPNNMINGRGRQTLDRSIQELGNNYIDLMLIHWPSDSRSNKEAWQIMEEYVDQGKIRSIGVSNFSPAQVEELLRYARIKPVLNQIEIHPYNTQLNETERNKSLGLIVQTWSPLGANGVLKDSTLAQLARKYNRSVAQIILRWNIQRGLVTIPRSRNENHIAENLRLFDFSLSDEDMATINSLNRNQRSF